MSMLHVWLPPLAQARRDPAFSTWLAHGDRLPNVPGARAAALRSVFRFAGAAIPVAALRHHAVANDAGVGAWLAADPAYVRSEAAGARLMQCPIGDLPAEAAEQLAHALRPLFGDAGVPLAVDAPTAWCAHLPGGAPPAGFMPPAHALGIDLLECLPPGEAGRSWRRLFNEAQVILHAHPVNAARVAAGKVPVNALWFWGAGALPAPVDTALQFIASTDAVVRGLAKATGLACVDPAGVVGQGLDACGTNGDVLLDLGVGNQGDFAAACLPVFRSWLRRRRFEAIEMTFADGERRRVRHAHRWRFWRRA
jgi:hypothetical protein